MTLTTLSLTLVFVALAVALSFWQRIEIERDMLVAAVRATVQLLAIGYILNAVFALKTLWLVGFMIAVMVMVAAHNASRRGSGLSGVFVRVLTAILISEIATQGFMLMLGIVAPTPRFVIPISGMIIGNAMIVSGLLLNRLKAEIDARRAEILVLLALGGTPRQAIMATLKRAIRAGLIPTVDNFKTIGLVQLPGMMTGLIVAGANPVEAVRYQLLIVYSFLASAAITSISLGFLTYPLLFNREQQLTRYREKA